MLYQVNNKAQAVPIADDNALRLPYLLALRYYLNQSVPTSLFNLSFPSLDYPSIIIITITITIIIIIIITITIITIIIIIIICQYLRAWSVGFMYFPLLVVLILLLPMVAVIQLLLTLLIYPSCFPGPLWKEPGRVWRQRGRQAV